MKTGSLLLGLFLSYCNLSSANFSAEQLELIDKAVKQFVPTFEIKQSKVNEFPQLNLYQVVSLQDLEVFWISRDGKYFFYGDILDVSPSDKKNRNLTDGARKGIRQAALAKFPQKDMIIFQPDYNTWGLRKPLGVITVFTDLTCPYGNNFHKEALKLTKEGVEVRYIFFPRSGTDSDGYKKAVAVWCSKDRNKAFTLATEGKEINVNSKDCKHNPIKKHLDFSKKIGIRGTPNIILSDGSLIGGYVASEYLIDLIKS